MKVDLRQQRGQRLAEGRPISLEVGREKLAFRIRGQGFLETRSESCGISTGRNVAPPGNEFRPQKAARADRPVVDQAALFAGQNDDVVVDRIGEADFRLRSS